MPRAFATAGWVVSLSLISFLGFMSYMTTTFVIEAMAAANAQLRWKRREQEEVDDSDSTSDYSDDDVTNRGRSAPETKPILSVQRSGGHVDHFDIAERVEMGQMASMFFNKAAATLGGALDTHSVQHSQSSRLVFTPTRVNPLMHAVMLLKLQRARHPFSLSSLSSTVLPVKGEALKKLPLPA
ncbi:Transmembrane protein 104 [Larimichthys crocea]|uniref:Transmembrane protein 104 n=1 Tax=Larimichthys crocea TaxID=215358 RepID=A0A6G0HU77_LARCR|nr:Transmembrane protein 104 [Larimichthys crocea]